MLGVKIVVGKSTLSKQMYSYIDLVAPTQMSVMIRRKWYSKEHVARMIHERSTRAKGPFIAVDCGSLSTELAPVNYSVTKGSFTSAIEDKTGFSGMQTAALFSLTKWAICLMCADADVKVASGEKDPFYRNVKRY